MEFVAIVPQVSPALHFRLQPENGESICTFIMRSTWCTLMAFGYPILVEEIWFLEGGQNSLLLKQIIEACNGTRLELR